MPNNRSGRIVFALVILVFLCIIGRNLYQRHRTAVLMTFNSELNKALVSGKI